MSNHGVTLPRHLTKDALDALAMARHAQPFDVLGPHDVDGARWVTTLQPGATRVMVETDGSRTELARIDGDVFAAKVADGAYRIVTIWPDGTETVIHDPYAFGPVLTDLDRHLIGEGTHRELWRALGAHVRDHEGVAGTHFAVWAPNARRVSVVGEFNAWDGRCHPMRQLGAMGVWEIFVPGLSEGETYQYEILDAEDALRRKSDPLGFGSQHPPEQASVVRNIDGYGWRDGDWMAARAARADRSAPISIYEVHLGSWRRRWDEGGRSLSYKELARDLVGYAVHMGFTHIELMPISEFPFDGSWGYQPVGLYAPTIRFGPPHEFRDLVDAAHDAGLGVILDWVPGHFPSDEHGLVRFDGTALYEHADPREGFHQDWNTLIPNYGRTEVRNYLVANALYWTQEYHLDGLRVDAVASMLYRDYSRAADAWVPNKDGGRENYEAIALLQEMNTVVYGADASVMTVAEESTSFPGVSRPVHDGGLGFGYKWNMGWMNDTLRYIGLDPVHRSHDHHLMTFPIDWAFTENFILPISHDEVVHGKGSMLDRMPGDAWQKFANLRAYYGFMWAHPGKKLLFMGCEFAQPTEWSHDGELDWSAAERAPHAGVQHLVRDLNTLYRETPALHLRDCEADGFRWLANDPAQSITAFARFGADGDAPVVAVCNFTPVERTEFQILVPKSGTWDEVLNTDAEIYGGAGRGNMGRVVAEGRDDDATVALTLPPLSVIVLRHAGGT
ncbi:1,4-alpha-glucan branching protein GlgB [Jannaschia donghaensis]|nr:1,4-alpha-glucan branching protein GlgB [Jannaschia donghaensis]